MSPVITPKIVGLRDVTVVSLIAGQALVFDGTVFSNVLVSQLKTANTFRGDYTQTFMDEAGNDAVKIWQASKKLTVHNDGGIQTIELNGALSTISSQSISLLDGSLAASGTLSWNNFSMAAGTVSSSATSVQSLVVTYTNATGQSRPVSWTLNNNATSAAGMDGFYINVVGAGGSATDYFARWQFGGADRFRFDTAGTFTPVSISLNGNITLSSSAGGVLSVAGSFQFNGSTFTLSTNIASGKGIAFQALAAEGDLRVVGGGTATRTHVELRPIAAQSATLLEWQNSGGTVLGSIDPSTGVVTAPAFVGEIGRSGITYRQATPVAVDTVVVSGGIAPYNLTITDVIIKADVSTTSTFEIYVDGTKVSATDPVTLTAGTSVVKSSFTGWTLNVNKGQQFGYKLTSNNNALVLTTDIVYKHR